MVDLGPVPEGAPFGVLWLVALGVGAVGWHVRLVSLFERVALVRSADWVRDQIRKQKWVPRVPRIRPRDENIAAVGGCLWLQMSALRLTAQAARLERRLLGLNLSLELRRDARDEVGGLRDGERWLVLAGAQLHLG